MSDDIQLKNVRSLIELRRSKVLELSAKGIQQNEIAKTLNVSTATISLDLQYLQCKAQENLHKHIHETLPLQFSKCMNGLHQVLKSSWEIADKETTDDKTKLQSLALVNECYKLIMELSSDGTVIERAMNFVKQNQPAPTKEDKDIEEEEIQQEEEEVEEEAE